MTCIFFGMNGHTIGRCNKKHVYPPGFKFKNKIHGVQAAVNHTVMDFGSCSHNYGYMDTNVEINNDGVNTNVVDSHVQVPVITPAQYNHLFTLLQHDLTGAKTGDKGVEL